MRLNSAKQQMSTGQPAFGFGLGLGSPRAAEVLAHSGIDFILIDAQHGSFGPDSVHLTLTAMAAGDAIPMARVSRNDYTMIGRLLDEGALGIVIPMVHTTDDAREAAGACRFPPVGTRSWGWGRAGHYGDDYPYAINDQVFVAVQIESAQAAQNAEAILSVPGVDGCWIGPSDLALSLGVDPRNAATDTQVQDAVERVLKACQKTKKIAGYAGSSPAEALRLAERGFQFLTVGSDIGFLIDGAKGALGQINQLYG
jgi:4-hydroxy-2-oxoheptanedioate aldolase